MKRHRRVIVTSLAFLVLLAYAGLGLVALNRFKEGMRRNNVKAQLEGMAQGIRIFFRKEGHYPSIVEFQSMADMGYWTDEYYVDPFWGHPFVYEPHGDDGFTVRWLGRDGRPGGDGQDEDFAVAN